MNRKKVITLFLIFAFVLAILGMNAYLSLFHSFDRCRLLGGTIYVVDAPFAGARECHLGSNSYNEADSGDGHYPQYHR